MYFRRLDDLYRSKNSNSRAGLPGELAMVAGVVPVMLEEEFTES